MHPRLVGTSTISRHQNAIPHQHHHHHHRHHHHRLHQTTNPHKTKRYYAALKYPTARNPSHFQIRLKVCSIDQLDHPVAMRAQASDPRKCREITKRGTLDNQSKNLYNPSFAQTENRGAGNFVTPLKSTLPAPFGSNLQWSFGHLAFLSFGHLAIWPIEDCLFSQKG